MPSPPLWIFALSAFLLVYKLGTGHSPMLMEYFYLQSAREMVSHNDWITPIFNGQPRFDKPILLYWLTLASSRLFGMNWIGARFVSSAAALGTAALTYQIGKQLFRESTARWAALVLMTTPLFILFGRNAIPDLTLTFFITLSLFAFLRGTASGPTRTGWLMLFYAAMAMATLTKGPIGILLPGLTAAGMLIARKDRPKLSELCLVRGTLIFFALLVPWFILILLRHGQVYVDYISEVLRKAAVGHERHSWYFYITRLFRDFLPWTLILLTGAAVVRGSDPSDRTALKALFIWMGVVFVFFSLISLKAPRYLLPLTPAFALATAWVLQTAVSSPESLPGRSLRWISLLAACVGFAGSVILFILPRIVTNQTIPVDFSSYAWPAFLFIASAVLLTAAIRGPGRAQAVGLACVMCVGFLTYFALTPQWDGPAPIIDLGRQAKAAHLEGSRIAVYHLHVNEMTFSFGPPVTRLNSPEELQRYLESPEPAYIVMEESVYNQLGKGLRVLFTASGWDRPRWRDGIEIIEEHFYLVTNRPAS
jgi:4-amino-4-deoxy-L-arabinose transferase-like glycosyltransferase